jgi:putative ABC transport system ATP-binding protein
LAAGAQASSEGPTRALVHCEGLSFRWPGAEAPTLQHLNLTLHAGEAVLLRGESGQGKSTLLSLLAGILAPSSGTLTVAGQAFHALSQRQRDRVRGADIGVIFQQFNLLPFLSILDNLLLPMRFSTERRARLAATGTPPKIAAEELLSTLGLSLKALGNRSVGALSVGQQQRVAAARALLGSPSLILADEPTSALDPKNRDAFLRALKDAQAARGAALLCVSHDPALEPYFDRTVTLDALQGGAP